MIGVGIVIVPRTSGTSVSVVTAKIATGVGETSFTANWNAFAGATYYLLDVSISPSFSSFVLEDEVVLAPTTAYLVADLTSNTTYYYRLRASTDAPPSPITATGGTITFAGGRTIHTFTSSGTFTVLTAPPSPTVKALVVAGGGGGGNYAGGGGGAGGLLYSARKSIAVTAYAITVGSGGAKPPNSGTIGTNGNNSVFDTLTAIGGGAGNVNGTAPNSGGSGGGGGAFAYAGAAGTAGQGFAGGGCAGGLSGAGGGGGAGTLGVGGTITENGGNGGDGLAYSISGTSTYYSGGGGGSGAAGVAGAGGGGGGGAGALGIGASAVNGTANTGGGGGGTWFNDANLFGNGGSGIVIISYPT